MNHQEPKSLYDWKTIFNMELRAIIIEDEQHSRETLLLFLNKYIPDVKVEGTAESVSKGIELVRKHKPDILFLDIEIKEGTSFDILQQLEDVSFEIIFTTAFEHYAIKAIKFSSIDYLLKPIDLDELLEAIEKVKAKRTHLNSSKQVDLLLQSLQSVNSPKNICLSTSEGFEFVEISNILYCEASGSYTKFFLNDNQTLLVSKNLKEYENLLSNTNFMRVHNSFLINLKHVNKYVKSDGGYILMDNDKVVSISPKKKDEFIERMSS